MSRTLADGVKVLVEIMCTFSQPENQLFKTCEPFSRPIGIMHAEMINSVQVSLCASHWQQNAACSYNKIKYTYFAIMKTPSQRYGKQKPKDSNKSQSIACIRVIGESKIVLSSPLGNRAGLPALFTSSEVTVQ